MLRSLPAGTRGLTFDELNSLHRAADEELLERAQYLRELVVENQAERRRKSHIIANRRRAPDQNLKIGDRVLRLHYRRERGVKGKIQRPFTAGYTVQGFSGPTGVVLMDQSGKVLASPVPRDQLYREVDKGQIKGLDLTPGKSLHHPKVRLPIPCQEVAEVTSKDQSRSQRPLSPTKFASCSGR